VGADSKYEEGKEILRLVIEFVVWYLLYLNIIHSTCSLKYKGIHFLGKLCKLFMHCSGPSCNNINTETGSDGDNDMKCEDDTQSTQVMGVSDGTRDILRFFSFIKPYFNPVSRLLYYLFR
jgi:hypothetical protein